MKHTDHNGDNRPLALDDMEHPKVTSAQVVQIIKRMWVGDAPGPNGIPAAII